MRIDWRKEYRGRSQESVLTRSHRFRRYILHLACTFIKASDLSAINKIRVQWINCDITILLYSNRMPFAVGYLTIISPGCYSNRTTLLLTTIHVIGKCIVCTNMIKLCGRLIIPGRKCFASIDRYDRALVTSQ